MENVLGRVLDSIGVAFGPAPSDDLEVVEGWVCSNYGDRQPHLQVRHGRSPLTGPCHDCQAVVVIRRRREAV